MANLVVLILLLIDDNCVQIRASAMQHRTKAL